MINDKRGVYVMISPKQTKPHRFFKKLYYTKNCVYGIYETYNFHDAVVFLVSVIRLKV